MIGEQFAAQLAFEIFSSHIQPVLVERQRPDVSADLGGTPIPIGVCHLIIKYSRMNKGPSNVFFFGGGRVGGGG